MTIIFYRNASGIGDACMLIPTIEKWHIKEPESEIIVVMDKPQSDVLQHHPAVSQIMEVEKFDITDFDNVRFFNVSTCCIQFETKRAVTKSRFEIFAEHCGMTFDRPGSIYITDAESRHIYDRMPILSYKANGAKIVGVVWKSSDEWRNYPHTQLLYECLQRNALFGIQKKIMPVIIDNEHQENSTADLDMRETIAFISKLDLVIGPDTGPMHMAGSLGVPTLWLFGPTDPNMRAKFYLNAHWFWHPCNKGQACWYDYCEKRHCLWNISPWAVIRKSRHILKKCQQ